MRAVNLQIYSFEKRLSLGELRCTTSSLETRLLSFLHSRVTSEETSLLQLAAEVLSVELKECTGDTVADCYKQAFGNECIDGDVITLID